MPSFKKTPAEKHAEELVKVRVTKRGAGQISTGKFDGTHGAEYYDEGDEFEVSRATAEALADEDGDRRFVEILPDDAPVKKSAARASRA